MDNYKLITRRAFDSVSKEYIKRDNDIVDETDFVKKALEKFINLLPQKTDVLDIGCGGGRDSRFIFKYGFKISGIDFSENMINAAKIIEPRIDYKVMDFEELNFPDNTFGGVWANASLHHIPKKNLLDVLVKIHKILKQGGIFFIKVKHGNADSLRENEKFGKKIKRYFAYYEPTELEGMLKSSGFGIIDTEVNTNGEWVDIFATNNIKKK